MVTGKTLHMINKEVFVCNVHSTTRWLLLNLMHWAFKLKKKVSQYNLLIKEIKFRFFFYYLTDFHTYKNS